MLYYATGLFMGGPNRRSAETTARRAAELAASWSIRPCTIMIGFIIGTPLFMSMCLRCLTYLYCYVFLV